jgi:hypothetical protein
VRDAAAALLLALQWVAGGGDESVAEFLGRPAGAGFEPGRGGLCKRCARVLLLLLLLLLPIIGFRVQGLGFGDLEFEVWGLGFNSLGFTIWGLGFEGLGFRV